MIQLAFLKTPLQSYPWLNRIKLVSTWTIWITRTQGCSRSWIKLKAIEFRDQMVKMLMIKIKKMKAYLMRTLMRISCFITPISNRGLKVQSIRRYRIWYRERRRWMIGLIRHIDCRGRMRADKESGDLVYSCLDLLLWKLQTLKNNKPTSISPKAPFPAQATSWAAALRKRMREPKDGHTREDRSFDKILLLTGSMIDSKISKLLGDVVKPTKSSKNTGKIKASWTK